MEMVKKEIQSVIDKLDESFEIEDLMYKLYVKEKLQKAKEDSLNGRIFSQEEIEREFLKE